MTTRTRTLLLEGSCLARQALARIAPEDPAAIIEGRLFANRRRIAHDTQPIATGQVVTWHAPRRIVAATDPEQCVVLDRHEGFVAASKPAAWSSEPDKTGSATSLRERLQALLHVEPLHIATRLDVGVSGLVLAATDLDSRRHLAKILATGNCHRCYVSIAVGHVPDRGHWQGPVDKSHQGKPRPAKTAFECVARSSLDSKAMFGEVALSDEMSLVMLRPETGHRHQLRIHSSRAGAPLLGDRRYGGPQRVTDATGRVTSLDRIFLHALATSIRLPNGTLWQPCCPLPEDFVVLWRQLGGHAEAIARIQP